LIAPRPETGKAKCRHSHPSFGGLRKLSWVIYCLIDAEEWKSKQHESVIAVPGPDGFVHCCDARQMAPVRRNYFPDGSSVVALGIDPTALDSETRYEPGSRGEPERFPHVYGPVRREDVVEVSVL
jgi:uncharacterized protein (DUF952 family)